MDLDFTENYQLKDDFVQLIPLRKEHILPLYKLSLDADIWTYFLEKGQGGTSFNNYINRAFQQFALKKEYPFVVFDQKKEQYAGMTRFYDYSPELNTIKLGHTWYGKNFRGTGINKRCKFLLFEFAFEQLAVERIGFGAYATNVVSLAAMKSVGCRLEGALRNFFPSINGNGRTDCVLYSILREEWLKIERAKLGKKIEYQMSKKLT